MGKDAERLREENDECDDIKAMVNQFQKNLCLKIDPRCFHFIVKFE